MGVLAPAVPKPIDIKELQKVTSWVLWSPFVVSAVAVILFSLVRLVIHYLPENEVHLKRWNRIRNSLAQIASGGEFFGVYSQQSIPQVPPGNSVQREQSIPVEGMTIIDIETQQSNPNQTMSNVTQDLDLFMVDRRIPAKVKGSWYNIYLLLLPLQVAIISIVIVHNIYNEEHYKDTCESFALIATNPNEARYYDCRYNRLSDTNNRILEKCNSTEDGNGTVSCSVYYYNPSPSQIILTTLQSLLLHITLAKGIVRFIIFMRYMVHKYGKSCRQKCPWNVHGSIIISNVILLALGITLLVYAVTADQQTESGLTSNIVLFAFTVIGLSVAFFQCGLLQADLYEPFARCSFNVTDEPKSINDEATNILQNQQTTENDQAGRNYFCCSNTETKARNNYDQI